jgi:hypothetical protein
VTLSTDIVQPRPDGVHLRVVNEYEEPVSVEGFDAEPGTTSWVFNIAPGSMRLMCWPYSQHGSGDEPRRHVLEIVDPAGLYVDGSVACAFEGSAVVDFAESVVDPGPPPIDVVRELLPGLRPDDVLGFAGYPEGEGGGVIVTREGEIIANYGFGRFEGEETWSIVAVQVCDGTGLPFEGESFN